MPRYYCDYCDTYLTHDSPSVRKQHNQGYKHKANVRNYYQQFEEQQTQSLIDQKVKEHLGQTAAFQHQLGATFALQSGQYRPPISAPVLPPPSLPVPGSSPAITAPPLLPTVRPPVLPRPAGTNPGYLPSPTLTPPGGAPPQANGLPRPPTFTLSAPGVRPVTATSPTTGNGSLTNIPTSGPPGVYQSSTNSGNFIGSHNYSAPPMGATGGYPQQRPNFTTPSSNPSSGFNLQQPSRAAPPGTTTQGNFVYGQSPPGLPVPTSSTPTSYGPSPTGTSVGFRN